MHDETFSSEVKAFIAQHARSVLELECLLLLHREPARQWNGVELEQELRIDAQWALRLLKDMAQRGLLVASDESPQSYRYGPRTPEMAETVRQLAAHYAERRVSMIELIYSKPSDPLKDFADAFRLRKDQSNG